MYEEYLTVSNIVGPLVIVEKIRDVKYGELVEIETGDGLLRRGTVLDVSTERAVVQVFEGTMGLDVDKSRVRFLGRSQQLGVSEEIIGRVFDGSAEALLVHLVENHDLSKEELERISDLIEELK